MMMTTTTHAPGRTRREHKSAAPAAPPTIHATGSTRLPPRTEFKTCRFEVKDVDEEQGLVTGYLSVFNNIDYGNGVLRDRVRPGAFRKTLMEAKSRRDARSKKFLFPHLWMHDPQKPTGGYLDAREDEHGLLVTYQLDISLNKAGYPNNPLAVMEFSGSKQGYIDEQSIGYETIQSRVVEEEIDGQKVYVRDLIELRLVEGSGVTSGFAMNPEAVITGVKAGTPTSADVTTGTPIADEQEEAEADVTAGVGGEVEQKATICGSTSGPLGPRDEAWDGGRARGQIFAAAKKEDGSLNAAVCRKYFMVLDGDPQNKGSWGYPFWYVGGSPHICVGAVKAIAAAIQGARGADAPAGLKSKVETLYRRINARYPDDPQLTPPWKARPVGREGRTPVMQFKTFAEHLAEEMCEDLLEDWQDVLLCALSSAVLDAFRIGDQPQADVQAALKDFGTAVTAWVGQAIEYGLTDYLEDHTSTSSSADYLMQYGSESRPDYGYHARAVERFLRTKAGRTLSAATRAKLQAHTDGLREMAGAHARAMHQAANVFLSRVQSPPNDEGENDDAAPDGKEEAAGDETEGKARPTNENDDTEQKAGRAISAARMQVITAHAQTVKKLATAHAKALRGAANDLEELWQQEGVGPADAGQEDEDEGEGEENGGPGGEKRVAARAVAAAREETSSRRPPTRPGEESREKTRHIPSITRREPSALRALPREGQPGGETAPHTTDEDADVDAVFARLQAITVSS